MSAARGKIGKTSVSSEKKLSCKRCQFRKLKCSRTVPCSNCTTADQQCQYRERDEKKRPLAREYTMCLEDRVAWLESLVMDIKGATPEDREVLLDSVCFADHLRPRRESSSQSPLEFTAGATRIKPELELDLEGSLIYHGPTSICRIRPHDQLPGDVPLPGLDAKDSQFRQVTEHFGINLDDMLVTESLALFFRWQYPFFMFIYREAFLRDHFGDRSCCKYWSLSLLLSVCAIGILMKSEADSRETSERFFAAAESIVLVSGLAQPSVTTVQALLCMSFYEIGRGNLSKGWGYSGMACRMAQDLGFQRDPKNWLLYDASLASTEDMEVRRRIYWGCYASDKLISLFLGRPVLLNKEDAVVELPERLPEFPEMLPWLPAGYTEHDQATSGTTILVQCFTEQVHLCSLVETLLSELFSSRRTLDEVSRKSLVDSLNLALFRWEASLPEQIRWHRWETASANLLPLIAALHVLYHGVRIVLNLGVSPCAPAAFESESARETCLSSMHDVLSIVRKFRVTYELKHAPLTFVYGLVQAFRASEVLGMVEEGQYALKTLDECSVTWSLARHVQNHNSREK